MKKVGGGGGLGGGRSGAEGKKICSQGENRAKYFMA